MKYKVGDSVRIKSLDWYNENKDDNREIKFENGTFTTLKSTFLGQIMTIEEITLEKQYILMEDRYKTLWTDEMIEGLVEEETLIERVDDNGLPFNEWLSHKGAFYVPEDYVLKDENGNVINAQKIVLEKKKKEYPKTYKECLKVLNIEGGRLCFNNSGITQYERDLYIMMNNLSKLLICRDAYWKIAGEEMELGKPWEPGDNKVFGIIRQHGKIQKYNDFVGGSTILEFSTEEMRDAFKENFKELIESCKELL